jgi:hypothetical protein
VIALGHIAGIPVEETLLNMLPFGAVGIGAAVCVARDRLRSLHRRRRTAERRGTETERDPSNDLR